MATGFPKRKLPNHATKGERKVFKFLVENLDDTAVVYYEPNIRGKRPDILIIGESLGVLVLEIKDYLIYNLDSINDTETVFNNGDVAISPLVQARNYSFEVCNLLRKDPLMCDDKGKFKFNYGHGIVFTNITRMEYISHGLDKVYPDNLVILKDDLDSMDAETLFETLYAMKPYSNSSLVSQDIRDRMRYILFPEVRVNAVPVYSEQNLVKFNDLVAMDLYQESLSRELQEGHRLVRGVAGSGKTLILVARAKLLRDKDPESKILLTCCSNTLKAYIKSLLGNDYSDVPVETFHEFIGKTYKLWDMDNLGSVVDNINSGSVEQVKLDHILIDEAQDMDPSWISFLFSSVKTEESSFLVCMDGAQNVFKRSLLSLTGIDFRGRSTVLSLNYRNPRVIINFAWEYYKCYSDTKKNPEIIDPSSASKIRGVIRVKRVPTFEEELDLLVKRLSELKSYKSVAIIYRVSRLRINYLDKLMKKLTENHIPFLWTSKDRKSKSNYNPEDNHVHLLTIEGSKGLSFNTVFMVAFTSVHSSLIDDTDKHVTLSYIGLTRSLRSLYITFHEDNKLSDGFRMIKDMSEGETKINSFSKSKEGEGQ